MQSQRQHSLFAFIVKHRHSLPTVIRAEHRTGSTVTLQNVSSKTAAEFLILKILKKIAYLCDPELNSESAPSCKEEALRQRLGVI